MVDINQAMQNVMAQYYGVGPMLSGVDVVAGQPWEFAQPRYAEYYPAGEMGAPGASLGADRQPTNPYHGTPTVSLNMGQIGSDPRVLEEVILADTLHRLPAAYPDLYEQFLSAADAPYLEAQRQRYGHAVANQNETRAFLDWLQMSGHDAIIRGHLLQNYPMHQNWDVMNTFPLSEGQQDALRQMETAIEGQPPY